MEENTQTNNNMPQSDSSQSNSNPLEGLEPNVAAALSYLIPPITGIIFYLIEKEDKFVRFHAFQSILFGIATFIATSIANMLFVVLIGFVLAPLVYVASIVLWFLLMWKAYNKEEYMLPYLGKMAKDQVAKQQ